jgi:hypothetical protein
VFPVLRAKPAAQVLVTHNRPTLRDPTGDKPLIAAQFVGAGRVMFTGTDDIYRWRTVFEPAYDRFWVKGIRFLFEGRLGAGNSRLRITPGEEKVELGQPIKVVVDARTETFDPLVRTSYTLAMIDDAGLTETIELSPVEGLPGQFEVWVRPTRIGWFRFEPTVAVDGRPVQARFQVVPAQLEKEGPADVAELAAIAQAPGGSLVASPIDLAAALDRIEPRTRIESFRNAQSVWDSWVTVLALVGVLAAEWWLRKRSNLL